MLHLTTTENGLPYCLLCKNDMISSWKPSTHMQSVFSDTEYSFTLQETSSNMVYRVTTRLCRVNIFPRIARISVLLSAYVKTVAYQGMVM